ncbi:MAG: right-handed parallel beta-helix repeat-containing protein [Candidatus Kerfeldbacteria bacterium]|nr:right-handed parallel beta-helix repeat-containing protein [Candidatus Kerfeldbacteria bacterium]
MKLKYSIVFISLLTLLLPLSVSAEEIRVATEDEFTFAVLDAEPGDVIVVQPGTYTIQLNLKIPGTNEKPITIVAPNGATIYPPRDRAAVNVGAAHWILDGVTIDGRDSTQSLIYVNADGFVLKNSTLENARGSGVVIRAKDAVIENNTLRNFDALFLYPIWIYTIGAGLMLIAAFFGWKSFVLALAVNALFAGWMGVFHRFYGQNVDAHAVFVFAGSENITIHYNTIENLSGDGVHILNDIDRKGLSPAKNITITDNTITRVRENGIDIKTSENVQVRGNQIAGVAPSGTSEGSGIVIHGGATNITVENNLIALSNIGITVARGEIGEPDGVFPRNIALVNTTILSPRAEGLGNKAVGDGVIIREAVNVTQTNTVVDNDEVKLKEFSIPDDPTYSKAKREEQLLFIQAGWAASALVSFVLALFVARAGRVRTTLQKTPRTQFPTPPVQQ